MGSGLQGPGGGWGGHRGRRHAVVNLWEAEDKLVGRDLVARPGVRVAFRQGELSWVGCWGLPWRHRSRRRLWGPGSPSGVNM